MIGVVSIPPATYSVPEENVLPVQRNRENFAPIVLLLSSVQLDSWFRQVSPEAQVRSELRVSHSHRAYSTVVAWMLIYGDSSVTRGEAGGRDGGI